jgi:hypothetical protein
MPVSATPSPTTPATTSTTIPPNPTNPSGSSGAVGFIAQVISPQTTVEKQTEIQPQTLEKEATTSSSPVSTISEPLSPIQPVLGASTIQNNLLIEIVHKIESIPGVSVVMEIFKKFWHMLGY